MDNNPVEPLNFRHDPAKKSIRDICNDRFPDLEVDPIEIFVNAEHSTESEMHKLLTRAGVNPQTLQRLEARWQDEFQSLLTAAPNISGAILLDDTEPGGKKAVISVNFLANVIEQLQIASPDMETAELFHYGMRMCLTFTYGLLIYDEINPVATLESKTADRVNKRLALSILQTGLEDTIGNEESYYDLPPSMIPHYMAHVLPLRFGAAMMYADLEQALTVSLEKTSASGVLDLFCERRIAAVNDKALRDDRLAVSDIDNAFAYPLSSEDLRAIIQFGSMLSENTRAIRLVPPAE
jgi:hypothetical protein